MALTHRMNITDVAKPWVETMNHHLRFSGLNIKCQSYSIIYTE